MPVPRLPGSPTAPTRTDGPRSAPCRAPTVPVIRQPFAPGDPLPFWAGCQPPDTSYLFDTDADPQELENRVGERHESVLEDALAEALRSISAPADVLERIGLG